MKFNDDDEPATQNLIKLNSLSIPSLTKHITHYYSRGTNKQNYHKLKKSKQTRSHLR